MDRSGNHYLVKWMDGDVEMKTWEFHHFVKDSSLVDEKGYLKRNEEDAAATETKAEPPVQKEKSSEEREGKLAVGSPVWTCLVTDPFSCLMSKSLRETGRHRQTSKATRTSIKEAEGQEGYICKQDHLRTEA